MVRFILSRDSLIFVHNAPRHFTITNPETHEMDQKEGCLGDINSIVSIAFSAKRGRKDNNIRIGKFGIGFKSVFQYTTNRKSMMMVSGFHRGLHSTRIDRT